LDCSEKPSKNSKIRKTKTNKKPKPIGLKVRPKRTELGQKRIAQESYKTESINILAKRKSMLRVAQ